MTEIRHDWTRDEVLELIQQPLNDLLFSAQSVHRAFHNQNEVQISRLLSIKTGRCPEDCAYCPQSIRFNTGLKDEELVELEKVMQEAHDAKESGATRFCMGAAWRSPKNRDMPLLIEMVKQVKDLGMETCMTLGMLTPEQAGEFGEAGLDHDWPCTLEASRRFDVDAIAPGRGDALVGTKMVNEALDLTADFVKSTYGPVAKVALGGGSLKEAWDACRASCDDKFGDYAIYEHCLPFNVARAYDEARDLDTPRIWTAERDKQLWTDLQG